MAPRERPWFRLYAEIARDRKLRRCKPETRWLFIAALCIAGTSPRRGVLLIGDTPATLDDLTDEAALPPAKVRSGLTELEREGIIDRDPDSGAWRIVKWDTRQYEHDRSAGRTRQWRAQRRHSDDPDTPFDVTSHRSHNGRHNDVTVTAVVTAPETETETETPSSSRGCRDRPVENPPDDDDDRTASQAIQLIVDRRQHGRTDIRRPDAWRQHTTNDITAGHGLRIAQLAAAGHTPTQIADLIEPVATPPADPEPRAPIPDHPRCPTCRSIAANGVCIEHGDITATTP